MKDPTFKSTIPAAPIDPVSVIYILPIFLASGMAQEEIIDDFPELGLDDIQAAIAYATDQFNRTKTIVSA